MVLRGARLFDVRCGDVEIWHGVAFLYRDAHWLTPEPIVDDVKSRTNTAGFSISIRGRFPAQSEIDYRIDVQGAEDGAVRFVAGQRKIRIADDATVTASVGIGKRDDGRGFGLDVALAVDLPGIDAATARELVDAAHIVCPYSEATRGNLDVRLSVVEHA